MNNLSQGVAGSDDIPLNESNLPVELQTRNIVNPAFIVTGSIPVTILNGDSNSSRAAPFNGATQEEPRVVITEQPQQRGFRFRYECEGPSHGGLQGTRSERSRKSFPTIKVENYTGACRVVVSLATDEKTPRSHAHKLVGVNCRNGHCAVEIKANPESIQFQNMCILHVTRKKLVDVLTERILDTITLNKKLAANNINSDQTITDEDRSIARQQAEDQSKNMQLNVVRLCFQVFLRNADGSFSKMLQPVFSQPIYDSKSPGASALKICRMDKYGGCCSGNEEVFLLCEKVQKDDIQVRFVEQNDDGSVKWEAYGNFGPLDVHRQYAIVFKTPAYYNTNIDKAVNVLIMLQRKSDKEVSEPKAFTYFPQNRDKDNIASKKRKRIPLDGYDFGEGGGGGGFGGLGGDGSNSGGDGMDGGGGGGLGGGSGGMYMLMHGNDVIGPTDAIPTPVQEVARKNIPQGPTDSDRLQAVISSTSRSTPNPFTSDTDPWVCSSDVEVDTAPESIEHSVEDDGHILDEDGKSQFHLKSVTETSMDSAYGKSIQILDVKSPTRETARVPFYYLRERGGEGDEKEETRTTRSSVSDYHSEPDVKDIMSVGVRSDEGFSETSEDAASKGQKLSSNKLSKPALIDETVKGVTMVQPPSQITEMLQKVTGRVADRTISALVDFAETGDIRHLLLVQRQLMTVNNKNGDLPLHLAVINSQPQALKSLVDVMCTLQDSKQHINSLNTMRQTPLHIAAITNQPQMVEILLHAGADPSIADRHGNTAAHLAIANGAHKCLSSLVKYLRPGQSRMKPFPELDYLNFDGFSPIHLAAQAGNVAMLRTLLFGQADVNLPDGKSGKTALHHAVDNDDLPVAGFLLMEAHTYVNARCFDGNTALHIACARQLVAMVALLVTSGADQDCENEEIPDQEVAERETDATQDGGAVRMMDRPGLRPVDYAEDNEQILKILHGEAVSDSNIFDAPLLTNINQEDTGLEWRLSQATISDHTPASQVGTTQ